jgi:hypothetical protein
VDRWKSGQKNKIWNHSGLSTYLNKSLNLSAVGETQTKVGFATQSGSGLSTDLNMSKKGLK